MLDPAPDLAAARSSEAAHRARLKRLFEECVHDATALLGQEHAKRIAGARPLGPGRIPPLNGAGGAARNASDAMQLARALFQARLKAEGLAQ